MELIDRDRLAGEVGKAYGFEDRRGVIGYAMTCIANAPTVEAEPVKHSKWIPIDHTNDAFCENCGCERGSKAWNKDDFNFCPQCGARMDGGAD